MLVEACNSDPPKHQHQNLQNTAFTESPHPCLICRGSLAIDRHRNRPRTSTDYNGNYLYSIYIYRLLPNCQQTVWRVAIYIYTHQTLHFQEHGSIEIPRSSAVSFHPFGLSLSLSEDCLGESQLWWDAQPWCTRATEGGHRPPGASETNRGETSSTLAVSGDPKGD